MTPCLQTDEITYNIIPSPLGLLGLASTNKGLFRIHINIASEKSLHRELTAQFHSTPLNRAPIVNLEQQLELYFAGKLRTFSFPLDIDTGTLFQKKVWRTLTTIPYGSTRNYEWLARSIGNPKACRAAGNANGQNPLPIIIPCHRVVRKNGDLGGYTGGSQNKQFLLNLEQTHASL